MTAHDTQIAADYDYHVADSRLDRTISFRRVTMERDLGRLHRWLGAEHVKPYWELDLSLPAFRDRLAEKLADPHLVPYVGYLDHVPMSYWEWYWAAEDDVATHYDARPTDRGLHLLIGPEEYLGRGYAEPLLRAAVDAQFRHLETDRVIAEPDARNDRVASVFEDCGFRLEREFHFEEAGKDANLYVCERERFESSRAADAPADDAAGDERGELNADD